MMQELNYIRCGDYYIPDIRLPKETRPIGRWGRMHRDYIKEHNPIISAIKKLAIKEVVLYSDRKIAATKELVSKNNQLNS